jgi:histone-lysine N-methyltransferase MLL3
LNNVCLQVKVFPKFISGEDLFGLNETNVIKVLESLPGIESLTDYHFKYGRNPLLELPLAVNPTGCARSEPLMRTRVKRIHNFQRSMTFNPPADKKTGNGLSRAAKESVPLLIGLETTGPYSKNFVQSKSSQYRKMKQEWRQNVVLARSGIQGLGLYAARDIEKHQVSILFKPFFFSSFFWRHDYRRNDIWRNCENIILLLCCVICVERRDAPVT